MTLPKVELLIGYKMNSILERVNTICRYVRLTSNQDITFKKLINSSRSAFRKFECDVAIKSKKDKSLSNNEFYVHAYYDAEDDFNSETPIEVIVHHNFADTCLFNEVQITEFLIQVYDATVHEFKHQQQSIKRNYEIYSEHAQSPYRWYLKDPDEVDAYSLSIAVELLRSMSRERAIKYMKKITVMAKMRQGTNLVSPNLKAYIDHFGFSKLTKHLAKKIYKHLNTLDKSQIFM